MADCGAVHSRFAAAEDGRQDGSLIRLIDFLLQPDIIEPARRPAGLQRLVAMLTTVCDASCSAWERRRN